jgi:hypothetical protein
MVLRRKSENSVEMMYKNWHGILVPRTLRGWSKMVENILLTIVIIWFLVFQYDADYNWFVENCCECYDKHFSSSYFMNITDDDIIYEEFGNITIKNSIEIP